MEDCNLGFQQVEKKKNSGPVVSNLSSSLKDWPKVKEEVDRRIQVTRQQCLPKMGLIRTGRKS